MKKIDFEAHFYTDAYIKAMYENQAYPKFKDEEQTGKRRLWYCDQVGQPFADFLLEALLDLDENRIGKMDANGVDIQILSLSAPGLEQLPEDIGPELSRRSNDELAAAIARHPDRFRGFAALWPKNPESAADELERCVKELGFIGWNTHSNFGDSYLDDPRYLPILQRAAELKVPVYLHPTVPAIPQAKPYGFALAGAPFGFGMETALCMMRLIMSGVFDGFPDLKVILGHLGEGLPFIYKRIDWAYVRPFDPAARPKLERKPGEYLKTNVFVTTSGNYYQPAFQCTVDALGIDRILLGTDFPYEDMEECIEFIDGMSLSSTMKEMIYSRNAEVLDLGF
jgi:uncharacterized protein